MKTNYISYLKSLLYYQASRRERPLPDHDQQILCLQLQDIALLVRDVQQSLDNFYFIDFSKPQNNGRRRVGGRPLRGSEQDVNKVNIVCRQNSILLKPKIKLSTLSW